jgi:protein SCO1/2
MIGVICLVAECRAMETAPRRSSNLLIGLVIAVLATTAGVAAWLGGRALQPAGVGSLESGTLLSQPRRIPSFSLTRHDGQAATREDLEGRWSILFFGFTHCPDVCPTTLFMLRDTMRALDEAGSDRPAVILVSLDPMRDTVEVMGPYVTYFDPSFAGFTGELTDVQELADGIGVAYAYVAGEGEDYSVDHTASLFLIDPQGQLAALFNPPHDPAALARDLTEVLR